jgi:hypothetical protein
VVRVVEADADEFAHAAPGRRHPAGLVDPGQGRRVESAQAFQVLWRQRQRRDVGNDAGEVVDAALVVDEGGLLGTLGP